MRGDQLVKVCGLREEGNVRDVLILRPDLVGFIFHPHSPRDASCTSPIGREVTAGAKRVGVFVDATPEKIEELVESWELDALQLHGRESPDTCSRLRERLKISVFKAFPVGEELPLISPYEGSCDLYLFDTKGRDHGGNGVVFDWSLLAGYEGTTGFLLAGGIGPETAESLTTFCHPCWRGIDINSRVEKSPGVKDIGAAERVITRFREMRSGG